MKYEVNCNSYRWSNVINHGPLKYMDIVLILQTEWTKWLRNHGLEIKWSCFWWNIDVCVILVCLLATSSFGRHTMLCLLFAVCWKYSSVRCQRRNYNFILLMKKNFLAVTVSIAFEDVLGIACVTYKDKIWGIKLWFWKVPFSSHNSVLNNLTLSLFFLLC